MIKLVCSASNVFIPVSIECQFEALSLSYSRKKDDVGAMRRRTSWLVGNAFTLSMEMVIKQPAQLITAPAQPPATRVAVYTTLFYLASVVT